VSYSEALAALQAVVNTYATANALPVLWDAMERAPVPGETFLACTFMPARSTMATLGPTGADEKPGLYQISVCTRRGRGAGAALAIADALVAAFKRQRLTVGGTTVHSWRAHPAAGVVDGDLYVVPVTVEWVVNE
jgi:hypothetical protein